MVIKFRKVYPDAATPIRATRGAVGYDAIAYHIFVDAKKERKETLPFELLPGDSILVGTGIQFAVPDGYECQVRPRSGLANKFMVQLLNSPGTIDPDFRGEAGILLFNQSKRPFTIEKGMRIAQFVFAKVELPVWEEAEVLPPTRRDEGGFGSTGLFEVSEGDAEYKREQLRVDSYFMSIAISVSKLSNCLRGVERDATGNYPRNKAGMYIGASRNFGCVIVQGGNILAQGFNHRTIDCTEQNGCIRENNRIPSGRENDQGCLHAEEVAIQNHARSGGTSLNGAAAYTNAEPCLKCAKLLMGIGISTVVVPTSVYESHGLRYLHNEGIEIRRIDLSQL